MTSEVIINIGKQNDNNISLNLNKTKTVFISGACAGGKTILLHRILNELFNKYKNENDEYYLVDAKFTDEFADYTRFKNVHTVNGNIPKLNEALDKVLSEDNKRIFLIVDELSDLMFSQVKNLRDKILSIIKKAHKKNINFIAASQIGAKKEMFSRFIS